MTNTEFATLLNWNEKNIFARLGALGLLATCSRCAGSGHFSQCQQYGTTCFKCRGNGKQLPKLTAKLADIVTAKVNRGELDRYLSDVADKAAARKAIAPLVAEAKALYEPICARYSAESRKPHDSDWFITTPIYFVQTLANAVYWGVKIHGIDSRSIEAFGVRDIERGIKFNEIKCPVVAVRLLTERVEMLRSIRAEFDAMFN